MQHDQIIKTLEGLIPKGVEQGPENVLLKYASDNNLAPAQLERLAQMYNVAMTLNFMDKSANRGASFTVIDVPDLLGKFTDPVEKEAALPADWGTWFETAPMSKAASTFKEAASADDFVALARGADKNTQELVFNEAYEEYASATSAGFWDSLAKEASAKFELESVTQMIHDAEEDFRKVASSVEDLVRTGADFQEMAVEAQSLHKADGVKAASALHNYLKHTGMVGNACSTRTVRIVKDTWKSESLFKEAAEALTKIKAAKDYLEFCKESATKIPREGNFDTTLASAFAAAEKSKQLASEFAAAEKSEKSKGPRRAGDYEEEDPTAKAPAKKNQPKTPRSFTGGGAEITRGGALDLSMFDTPEGRGPAEKSKQQKSENKGGKSEKSENAGQALLDLAGAANEGIKGITDPETYTQGMTFESHLQKLKGLGSGKNKTQQGIDQALADTKGITTVQRLMMTDPIISKADPELVVSLTNTLAKASPQVRNDPNLLRMALREAIQYEAIPMHTFKDLIEMEQRSQATQELKNKNEDSKYKI